MTPATVPHSNSIQLATYNAAADLLERNLAGGRAGKVAVMDDSGSCSYSTLAERAGLFASLLRELEVQPEQRIVLCLLDGIDFHTCFLGAIQAGIVPIPVNTMCSPIDYAWILADSRAKAAIVSAARIADVVEAARIADWHGRMIVSGQCDGDLPMLADLLEATVPASVAAATRSDDVCFWLYTSGSTGKPKVLCTFTAA